MQLQPIDWSATAAWIALVISVTGTIVGPIITTILTNRHQLKIRKMDIIQRTCEKYEDERFEAINTFIAKSGKHLVSFRSSSAAEFGEAYHCIYQYVPEDFWPKLDEFYIALITDQYGKAKELYPEIIHKLASILKEPPQVTP